MAKTWKPELAEAAFALPKNKTTAIRRAKGKVKSEDPFLEC